MKTQSTRRFLVALAALLGLALGALPATVAAAGTAAEKKAEASFAEARAFEIEAYAKEFQVSKDIAQQRLELQERGALIVKNLERVQREDYAGVWFDNARGEFVVAMLGAADRNAVAAVLNDSRLAESYRAVEVQSSWTELQAAQKRLDQELFPLIEDRLVMTAIEPRTNAVVIRQAEGVKASERAQLRSLGAEESVEVEVKAKPVTRFNVEPTNSCDIGWKSCDYPLRGGVELRALTCSAAFKAIGNTYGNRFLLTAGHCATAWPNWSAANPYNEKLIGPTAAADFPVHDWAAIKANGSYWDGNPWPSMVALWGVDHQRTINSEATSYLGQFVCRTGRTTGTSCGQVTGFDITVPYAKGTVYNMTEVKGACALPGDSGGPVITDNTALGIVSGRAGETCPNIVYFAEVTQAADHLGVTVGPRYGAPPSAQTLDPSNVQAWQSTWRGKVDPNGMATTYQFEYGPTPALGISTEVWSAGSAWTAGEVSKTLSVNPNTTYYYRVKAHNAFGSSYGQVIGLTTPTGPPLAAPEAPADVKANTAQLHGKVNPSGALTSYFFEWGTSTAYGAKAPASAVSVGNGVDYIPVQVKISGLQDETTYHYRLVAHNGNGTTHSADESFTTPALPEPATGEAYEAASGVMLQGALNPRGSETSYWFEYGKTTGYGSKAPVEAAVLGSTSHKAVNVSVSLGVLPELSTYHYRLVATNPAGTAYGADKTFTTGTAPEIETDAGVSKAFPFRAGIGGMIDPKGSYVKCVVEYGKTGSLGETVGCSAVGSASPPSSRSVWLSDLREGTTYHYRLVGISNYGTVYGEGETFTTTDLDAVLSGVHCAEEDECVAVGSRDEEGQATAWALLKHEGEWVQWPEAEGPGGGQISEFTDVSCSSVGCMLSGDAVDAEGNVSPLLYMGNWLEVEGEEPFWEAVEVSLPGGATEASLKSADCGYGVCRAVGYYEDAEGVRQPLMVDESGTSSTPAGPEGAGGAELRGISCVPTKCYAVGGHGAEKAAGEEWSDLLFLEWNGSSWKETPVAESWKWGTGPANDVSCAVIVYPTCSAVGMGGSAYLVGGYWAVDNVGPSSGADPRVSCLKTPSYAMSCGAVGSGIPEGPTMRGSFRTGEVGVVKWHGWWGEDDPSPLMGGVSAGFRGISCPSVDDCMAVGWRGDDELPRPYRWDGSDWTAEEVDRASHLGSFGSAGSGNGQFSSPRGVAVDPSGNFWVVDSDNDRVQRFDSTGKYLSQFGEGELSAPSEIARDSSGDLWIVDAGNHRIQKYDFEGELLTEFPAKEVEGEVEIGGIATDSEGHLLVVNAISMKVEKYDSEGEFVSELGAAGSSYGQLMNPHGVAVAANGDILVVDAGNDRIQRFDSAGKSIEMIEPPTPGQLSGARDIAIDSSGHLWVAATGKDRVLRFNAHGEYLNQFGPAGGLKAPHGVGVDAGGDLWVVDSRNNQVQRWAP